VASVALAKSTIFRRIRGRIVPIKVRPTALGGVAAGAAAFSYAKNKDKKKLERLHKATFAVATTGVIGAIASLGLGYGTALKITKSYAAKRRFASAAPSVRKKLLRSEILKKRTALKISGTNLITGAKLVKYGLAGSLGIGAARYVTSDKETRQKVNKRIFEGAKGGLIFGSITPYPKPGIKVFTLKKRRVAVPKMGAKISLKSGLKWGALFGGLEVARPKTFKEKE